MYSDTAAPQAPPIAAPSGMPAMPSAGSPACPNVSAHCEKIATGVTMNEVSIGVVVSPAPFNTLEKIWLAIITKKLRKTIRT